MSFIPELERLFEVPILIWSLIKKFHGDLCYSAYVDNEIENDRECTEAKEEIMLDEFWNAEEEYNYLHGQWENYPEHIY